MRSRSAGAIVLAGVTLLSAGGATGFLLRPAAAPTGLQAAGQVTSAPVGREELSDERTVKISLRSSTAPPLVVGFGGRVTATSCRAGKALESGEEVARINDVPLIALATEAPLHRGLRRDDEGDDVQALQRELSRLGHDVVADGTFGPRTTAAVKELQEAAGVDRPSGTIDPAKILWLPAPSVVPESCELAPGAYVASGQTYAKVADRLTAIVVESMPPTAVAGERLIEVMGVAGPLNKDGTASDAKFLRKVSETQEYRLIQTSEQTPELTAVIALKNRLQTLKVPPGALFGVAGDRGCLQSGPTVHAVRIVGSRLGATLVVLKGAAPTTVNLGSSITASSCG